MREKPSKAAPIAVLMRTDDHRRAAEIAAARGVTVEAVIANLIHHLGRAVVDKDQLVVIATTRPSDHEAERFRAKRGRIIDLSFRDLAEPSASSDSTPPSPALAQGDTQRRIIHVVVVLLPDTAAERVALHGAKKGTAELLRWLFHEREPAIPGGAILVIATRAGEPVGEAHVERLRRTVLRIMPCHLATLREVGERFYKETSRRPSRAALLRAVLERGMAFDPGLPVSTQLRLSPRTPRRRSPRSGTSTLRERVLAAMAARPDDVLSPARVAALIPGTTVDSARNTLLALAAKGQVRKHGAGKYQALKG